MRYIQKDPKGALCPRRKSENPGKLRAVTHLPFAVIVSMVKERERELSA